MFTQGQRYKRKDLHKQLGGQWQSGISTPRHVPVVLLFSGETGEQYGYHDGWTADGTFSYSGEGQSGDMSFKGGNRAIRDHVAEGKDLHLFQSIGNGNVRYLGQMFCAGFHYVHDQSDYFGNPRRMIQFHLVPLDTFSEADDALGTTLPIAATSRQLSLNEADAQFNVAEQSSSEARDRALSKSELLRKVILERANGVCESCGTPAPFLNSDGEPYLEIHHVWRTSDGGPDHPSRVMALCPNCHRRAHKSSDRQQFNDSLKAILMTLV